MIFASPYKWLRTGLIFSGPNRALGMKAIIFSLVGVINTLVDYVGFLVARSALGLSAAALTIFAAMADSCHCGTDGTILLIAANLTAWIVAVTGSYIMNSLITFVAESGRRLRWRAYITFVMSGVAALITNTAILVLAAQVLLLPIWLAKAVASFVSVVLNFSLLHFVVFRSRAGSAGNGPEKETCAGRDI